MPDRTLEDRVSTLENVDVANDRRLRGLEAVAHAPQDMVSSAKFVELMQLVKSLEKRVQELERT